MKLQVPYGKDQTLELEISEDRLAGVVEPNEVAIGDEAAVLRQALANPSGGQTLREFLKDARDVLFIVNDATRPTPTSRVLDILEKDIAGCPVSFLIATGIHRAPTHEEYAQIFSEKHYRKYQDRIFAHNARTDEMVFLGKSKNGTEMRINRRGVDAHRIVIITSVEPHYFAGYTGGRKSFLPGIAAYDTIEQNHKLALRPEARALKLEGNPVHEDMVDALAVVQKEIFVINTVLDKNHRIYAATAGDIHASFAQAIRKAEDVFIAKVPQKADIVVAVVKFPADIDLYQAQKGIENAKYALKEGGILILVAKCRMGIGEESFVNLLSSADSPQKALDCIEKKYIIGYHKAAKIAELGLWAETCAVTDLDPEVLKRIFIRPCSSLQAAVDAALLAKGKDAKVLVLLDASLVIPHAEDAL